MTEEVLKGYAILEDGSTVKIVDLGQPTERDTKDGVRAKCAKCSRELFVYLLKEDVTKGRSIHKCN